MTTSIKVRSFLPGRVRLEAELLVRRKALAARVQATLSKRPQVTRATVSPVTGSVLLLLEGEYPAAQVIGWLQEALGQQPGQGQPGTDIQVQVPVQAQAAAVPQAPASPLRKLLATTDAHRGLRRRAMVLSVANGLEDVTPPLLVGLAADTVTRGSVSLLARLGFKTVASRLFALGGFSAGLWLLSSVIEYLSTRSRADLANAVRHDLRVTVYKHVQSLDMSEIEARDVSDWMAILDADINQIHGFIHHGVSPFFNMATNLVVVGATFLMISPAFALAQLLMAPPLILVSRKLLGPIRARHIAARDDVERLGVVVSGNIAGMATIAGFNAQALEARRVEQLSLKYTHSKTQAERLEAVYVPTVRAVAGAGFVSTVVWGSARVANGMLSAGMLNTVALTQLRVLSAMGHMGHGLDQFQNTANALERVYATLSLKPSIRSGPAQLNAAQVRGEIELSKVSFGYEEDRNVLHGVDMHIPAGATVGIVGPSGAGKSTIMKLLLRFYDPVEGEIRIDGQDVRQLQTNDLRSCMALVSQQVTIFAGTIRDNIAYGRRDATMREVIAAAIAAEAHAFIMALPEQYETRLGFGGLSLSGGQRQRLSVARAVLADRPIVLFDEATSALDFQTEAALQRSLRSATQGKTTILVAHRLSTVRHADMIYVLDKGLVRECGRHDELIAANGIYAGMWLVQTGERNAPALPRPEADQEVVVL